MKILSWSIGLLASLPTFFLNWLKRLLSFILMHIVCYRKKVVKTNLRNSFSSKSDKELSIIEKKFYNSFAAFLIETLISLGKHERYFRFCTTDLGGLPNELEHLRKNKKNVILLTSHTFNWEYILLHCALKSNYKNMYCAYKPLSNSYFEKSVKKARERSGVKLVDTNKIYKAMLKTMEKKENFLAFMIIDQCPHENSRVICYHDFLNQPTFFFAGAENLAKKTNACVYFLRILRKGEANYGVLHTSITENPKQEKQGFITRRFAMELQKTIDLQPENWLWTHRRWKKRIYNNIIEQG